MNNIDNILNNYFEGASTPDEEKRLKEYFRSKNNVLPQHEAYRPLFAAFDKEKQIVAPQFIIPVKRSKRKLIPMRTIWFSATSIAATILLIFTLFPINRNTSSDDDYLVYINGKAIHNPEKAQEYANKMFTQANEIIRSSYEPFVEATMIQEELDADKLFDKLSQKVNNINSINQ
jgi:hypothetical protein